MSPSPGSWSAIPNSDPNRKRDARPLSRAVAARSVVVLAFLSGIPALVYQVVWTRQVGLLAGGQLGAISVVLVAFFGGLAIGTRLFGSIADRSASPLRLYGRLEIGAGVLAATSAWTLRWLGIRPELGELALLAISAGVILPATILLGGTLPALLRSLASGPESASRHSGHLVGLNTAGSVLGVGVAVLSIPILGLRASLLGAAVASAAVGLGALFLARKQQTSPAETEQTSSAPAAILVAAFLVGAATLGFEVLATRLATLRLGSSLYAWGLVLSLFLVGLAVGNLAMARRASTTKSPERDLGWLEVVAACAILLGLAALRPTFNMASATLSTANLLRVAIGVVPAATAMGAAFPLLARLTIRDARIGAAFGQLSAINTLGGIAGALLAPFLLLPTLGSIGAGLVFAAVNSLVGLVFLVSRISLRPALPAVAVLLIACIPILRSPRVAQDPWVLFVAEGRQATAVVTNAWGNRTLIVDGDPEASSAGNARRTEELLAVLPLILHPAPERFLEIGLGSGITLGTASRFSLEQLDCVEIAESVIRAAEFFVPDNRGVASDPDLATIVHDDARRILAKRPDRYDIVSANTLHPWSIGATGLYSREYFERMSAALRPGGIAVQWIPTEQIGAESITLILRTFFDAFSEGALFWGAGNIIAVGSRDAIPAYDASLAEARIQHSGLSWHRLGWRDAHDVLSHRIASAAGVRAALGPGDRLEDDRPLLEVLATRRRGDERASALYRSLVSIAKQEVGNGAMLFWLESLELRSAGDDSGADAREALAADLGLDLARRARVSRRVTSAHRDLQAGRVDEAAAAFEAALASEPGQRYALFGRAGVAIARGDFDAAILDLNELVSDWPTDLRAWNELAGVHSRRGDIDQARRAIDGALRADPFDIRALANAGLIAASGGHRDRGLSFLKRIRSISPLGQSPQEELLRDALSGSNGEPN